MKTAHDTKQAVADGQKVGDRGRSPYHPDNPYSRYGYRDGVLSVIEVIKPKRCENGDLNTSFFTEKSK